MKNQKQAKEMGTAQQWHDAWLLCATGRELEWEQLCYLTDKLSSAAQGLKDAAAHGNQAARRAYRKLNAETQYLWLCPAEKCEHKMPKQSPTMSGYCPVERERSQAQSELAASAGSAPVFALSYDDLQEIHKLTGMVCGWKMSLPTKMICQAQEVSKRVTALNRIDLTQRQRLREAKAFITPLPLAGWVERRKDNRI